MSSGAQRADRAAALAGWRTRLPVFRTRPPWLRELLQPPPAAQAVVEHRSVPSAPAAAVRQVIDIEDASAWYQGAVGELYATLAAQKISPSGPAGGIFATELFAHERGEATVFLPCPQLVRDTGRVEPVVIPAAELAITVHAGPPSGIDRAYGALATYVASHALGVVGPSASTTPSAAATLPTGPSGGRRSAGRSSAPALRHAALSLRPAALPELEPVPLRIRRPAEPAVRRLIGVILDVNAAARSWASIAARSSTR